MDFLKELQLVQEMKTDLDEDQMVDILHHAHFMMKDNHQLSLREAIGIQLEDIPGLEDANHEELISRIINMEL